MNFARGSITIPDNGKSSYMNHTPNQPLLELHGVSLAFGGLQAVERVSFRVPPGAVKAVIGPNGAGKTSLFHLISGFLAPQQGRISFQGEDKNTVISYQWSVISEKPGTLLPITDHWPLTTGHYLCVSAVKLFI
jgi:ABC-type phosphonate transport system ATPase subunit